MSGDPHITRLGIALAGSRQAVKMEQARGVDLTPEAIAHTELINAVQALLHAVVTETMRVRDVRV